MRGITNAPQGGGSSGGDDWIEHPSKDWSDIIEFVNYKFHFLKDVRFKMLGTSWNGCSLWTDVIIPAGTEKNSFIIPITQGTPGLNGTTFEFGLYFEIYSSEITGNTVRLHIGQLTVSGGTLSYTNSTASTSYSKGYIKVYYKD